MRHWLRTLPTSWQFFLAIAGVGLSLVLMSLIGLRLYFTYNFNLYLNAQEHQRLEEMALVIADYYEAQRTFDPEFTLEQLADLERNGFRRLVAGLSAAQWRTMRDGRAGPFEPGFNRDFNRENNEPPLRFSFRDLTLYDASGQRISGRVSEDSLRVSITSDGQVIGFLEAPRPQGPLQPIDTVFQQQQRTALLVAALAAVLLAGGAAWTLAARLRSRVRAVTTATRRLAQGDFRVELPAQGRDDLTQLSRDVNALATALRAASVQRQAFMADIAHELRTPLSVLQAELEAIEDGIRQPDPRELQLLQAQVHQLTQLVDDIRTLADADVGSLTYRWQTVDLVQWIDSQWPVLQQQAEQFGHQAELVVRDAPLIMQADSGRLSQLIHNLWANSLRYTDTPGQLRLSLSRSDTGDILLQLDDSAPGVPTQAQQTIFRRLYRVDSSRSRHYGGSGLGLAICQRISEAHGATITAKDSELGGLSVGICFPGGVNDESNLSG